MKFINSLILIFAIAVFLFAISKYIDGYSSDEDIAKIIYAQHKALEGDVEAVKMLLNQTNSLYSKQYEDEYIYIAENINKDFNENDSEYLKTQKLKRAINENKISFDEARKTVNSLTSNKYKGYAYALITRLLDESKSSTYDMLMTMSYAYLSSIKTGTADEEIFDIRDILIEKGDAKNYIKFWKLNSYSIYSRVHFYSTGANATFVAYYQKLLKDEEFKKNNKDFSRLLWYTQALRNVHKYSPEQMDKTFKYMVILSWQHSNYTVYKTPVIAALAFLENDMQKYQYYKDLSISKPQIDAINCAFIDYMNYCISAYCLVGDYEMALKCLEMIPTNRRPLQLKRNIRLFLKTKEGQEQLKRIID